MFLRLFSSGVSCGRKSHGAKYVAMRPCRIIQLLKFRKQIEPQFGLVNAQRLERTVRRHHTLQAGHLRPVGDIHNQQAGPLALSALRFVFAATFLRS